MRNYVGAHDRGGHHAVASDGWVVDLVALSENPPPTDYTAIRPDIRWLVRLGWGYHGAGTYPRPEKADEFVARAAAYINASKGVEHWIVGNEPNHQQQEWPDGTYPLTPDYTVKLFTMLQAAVPGAPLVPPAIAPYQHSSMPFWTQMLQGLQQNGAQPSGLAVHGYTRSNDPNSVHSSIKMESLPDQHAGFRAYRDFLNLVTGEYRRLPGLLTEFAPIGPGLWSDARGLMQAAVEDVIEWNAHQRLNWQLEEQGQTSEGATQLRLIGNELQPGPGKPFVVCVVAYRYSEDDQYSFMHKPDIVADLASASALRSLNTVPTPPTPVTPATPSTPPHDHPDSSGGTEGGGSDRFQWHQFKPADPQTPSAQKYGAQVEFEQSWPKWAVKYVNWVDREHAGGRRHIYVELKDDGVRQVGVPVELSWPNGSVVRKTEDKNGPWSLEFPITPGRHAFSVEVADGNASDRVTHMGMGEDTPSGFNPGEHTSFEVLYEWEETRPMSTTPPPTQPPIDPLPTQPPRRVPPLTHPVKDRLRRRITQRFGQHPEVYQKFGFDGHEGIDIGTGAGAEIVSVDKGRIAEVGQNKGAYGNYVKVLHDWGETVYAHLSEVRSGLEPGMFVGQGELLGKSGWSGNVDPAGPAGAHLHFGMRVNPFQRGDRYDGFVDPEPYLPAEGTEPTTPPPTVPPPTKPWQPADHPLTTHLPAIKRAADKNGIAWPVIASLVMSESSGNQYAVAGATTKTHEEALAETGRRPTAARGLMQIAPGTWKEWAPKVGATNSFGVEDNLAVGTAYLADLIKKAPEGQPKLLWALHAYVWGEGNMTERPEQLPLEARLYAWGVVKGADVASALVRPS